MATTRGLMRAGAGLALLGLLGLAGPAGAAAPPDLSRLRVLALNDLTGTTTLMGKARALAADPAGTKKLLEAATQLAKQKPPPLGRNASYVLALAAAQLKEVDAAARFFRLYAVQSAQLSSERGVVEGYVGLIELYYDGRRFTECEKACREFLEVEGEEGGEVERFKGVVERRLILAVAKGGAVDKALKMLDEGLERNPSNWLALALKGQVLREAHKLDDAAKVYLDLIDKVKKDKRLEKADREDFVSDYEYLLSGIYTDLEKIDKASDLLKGLIAKDPNNAVYLNDLGFIWADRGMNLPEAERMIRKALDEDRKLRRKLNPKLKPADDKDNPAHLDSLGWVLFKQGKAKEAKPHLLAAVKDKDGQHAEIYDHLGDVHKALGEKAEAVAAYQKAIKAVNPDSKRDQKRKVEVEKKIKALEGKK